MANDTTRAVRVAALAVARATLHNAPQEEIDRHRQELRTAKLEKAVRDTVDQFPPLTDEQRQRVITLLQGPDGTEQPPVAS